MVIRPSLFVILGVTLVSFFSTLRCSGEMTCAASLPTVDADANMAAHAQMRSHRVSTCEVPFKVFFRQGSSTLDPAFRGNTATLKALADFLGKLKADTTRTIQDMRLQGSVSPEGSIGINERLIVERPEALRRYLYDQLGVTPEGNTTFVATNVTDFINMTSKCKANAKVENYPDMRYAIVTFVVDTSVWTEYSAEEPAVMQQEDMVEVIEDFAEAAPVEVLVPETAEVPGRWHLKTNVAAWALLISNVAVEFDFGKRWSVAVPVYYGACNYFTYNVKFRALTVQPELRFWFNNHSDSSHRWFIGAHAGIGWYNFSLGGDYRIQDVGGHSPSLGGGLSAGYRLTLPWGSRNRWKAEFTLGVGAYNAYYDKFENRFNGPLVQSNIHTTFVGIDNAAITLIYTFN